MTDDAPATEKEDHIIVIKTDRPMHAEFPTDETKIGRLVRRFFDSGAAASYGLKPSPERVYLALASLCNGNHLRTTGEMVAWPSKDEIQKRTGFGAAIIPRAIDQLKSDGLITEVVAEVHGRLHRAYMIHEPEPLCRGAESRSMGRAMSTPVDQGARARRCSTSTPVDQGARARRCSTSTPVDQGARARMDDGSTPVDVGARACTNGQLFHSLLTACANETTTDETDKNETTTQTVTRDEARTCVVVSSRDEEKELIVVGVDAAVARQLAATYPARRIREVLAYAKSRKKMDNPGGLVREALEKNWHIPPAVAQQVERAKSAQIAQDAQAAQTALEVAQALQSLRNKPLDVVALALDVVERTLPPVIGTTSVMPSVEDLLEGRASALVAEVARVVEEIQADRIVAGLTDDQLADIAAQVSAQFQDNPPMLKLLTRKPPRESRLMKTHIATLLTNLSEETP